MAMRIIGGNFMGSVVLPKDVANLIGSENRSILRDKKNAKDVAWVDPFASSLGYDRTDLKSVAVASFAYPKMTGLDLNPTITKVVNKRFDLNPKLKTYKAFKTILGYQMVLLEQRIVIACERFLLEQAAQSEFTLIPTTIVRIGMNYGSGSVNETLKTWIIERFNYYLNQMNPEFNSSPDDDVTQGVHNSEICDETLYLIRSNNVNRALLLHFFSYEFEKLKITAPPYKHSASDIMPDDFDKAKSLGSYGVHHLSHLDETGYAPDGAKEANSFLPYLRRRVRSVSALEIFDRLLSDNKLQLKSQYYVVDAISCSTLFERWYDAREKQEFAGYKDHFTAILDNISNFDNAYDLDHALSSVFLSDYVLALAKAVVGDPVNGELVKFTYNTVPTSAASPVKGLSVGEKFLMMRTLELGVGIDGLHKSFIFSLSKTGPNAGKVAATESLLSGMLAGRLLSSQLHTQRALSGVLMNDSSVYSRP